MKKRIISFILLLNLLVYICPNVIYAEYREDSYQQLYINYFREIPDYIGGGRTGFMLTEISGDDIPELFSVYHGKSEDVSHIVYNSMYCIENGKVVEHSLQIDGMVMHSEYLPDSEKNSIENFIDVFVDKSNNSKKLISRYKVNYYTDKREFLGLSYDGTSVELSTFDYIYGLQETNEPMCSELYLSIGFRSTVEESLNKLFKKYDVISTGKTDSKNRKKYSELTNGIGVNLNGDPISFDVPPQIINNRTMVPFRAVFEAMGAVVDWYKDDYTDIINVDVCLYGQHIWLSNISNTMYVNGEEVLLDSPPCIINDRFLVPVRAISEALGAEVIWNDSNKTVEISYSQVAYSPFNSQQLSSASKYLNFLPNFKKADILNKDFANVFISEYAFSGYCNYGEGFEYGDDWLFPAGTKEDFANIYKLILGCDMPYVADSELLNVIVYNGMYAVFASDAGDCWYVYHHTEEKPDGSYDVIFNEVGSGEVYSENNIINLSFADNENGFIVNYVHHSDENGDWSWDWQDIFNLYSN